MNRGDRCSKAARKASKRWRSYSARSQAMDHLHRTKQGRKEKRKLQESADQAHTFASRMYFQWRLKVALATWPS